MILKINVILEAKYSTCRVYMGTFEHSLVRIGTLVFHDYEWVLFKNVIMNGAFTVKGLSNEVKVIIEENRNEEKPAS